MAITIRLGGPSDPPSLAKPPAKEASGVAKETTPHPSRPSPISSSLRFVHRPLLQPSAPERGGLDGRSHESASRGQPPTLTSRHASPSSCCGLVPETRLPEAVPGPLHRRVEDGDRIPDPVHRGPPSTGSTGPKTRAPVHRCARSNISPTPPKSDRTVRPPYRRRGERPGRVWRQTVERPLARRLPRWAVRRPSESTTATCTRCTDSTNPARSTTTRLMAEPLEGWHPQRDSLYFLNSLLKRQ